MTQTLDPSHIGADVTLSSGNLVLTTSASSGLIDGSWGTESFSTGKFYWEVVATTIGGGGAVHYYGISDGATGPSSVWVPGIDTHGICYPSTQNQLKYNNAGAGPATLTGYNQGDVMGVQWDAVNNTIQFSRNGSLQGSPLDISSGGSQPVPKPAFPAVACYTPGTANVITVAFAQASWQFTPATGFGPFDSGGVPKGGLLLFGGSIGWTPSLIGAAAAWKAGQAIRRNGVLTRRSLLIGK